MLDPYIDSFLPHFLFSQCAPVILAPHWTPAALRQVTATAGPITAGRRVTSVLLVTMVTQAAHVSPLKLLPPGFSSVKMEKFLMQ